MNPNVGRGTGLLEVGRVVKPHGLSGEVVVELLTNRTERVDPGSVLRVDGRLLEVERSRPFRDRWLVTFRGVDTLEEAELLRDRRLKAPAIEDAEALWVDELVGSVVRDGDGRDIGKVIAVLANPASDLLELEDGGLIPVRFVIERGRGYVVADVPTGLLD